MKYLNRKDRTTLIGLVAEMLYFAFVVGALYSFYRFIFIETDFVWLLYGTWFALSASSILAMLLNQPWGAYALGAITTIITIVDLVRGVSLLPGAVVGLLVLWVILTFIRQDYTVNEDEQQPA